MRLGTNLAGNEFWGTQVAWADAMKAANEFQPNVGTGALDLDPNGWVKGLLPGQTASAQILRNYPSGQYRVRYKGIGTFNFGKVPILSQTPGEMVLDYTSSEKGTLVTIRATDPADYLRDIEVLMSGTAEGDTFNPAFIESVRHYKELRFMNWQKTTAEAVQWSARKGKTYQTWTGDGGVPLEVICQLCNVLGIEPWFSVHDGWTDGTIMEFFNGINHNLSRELRVRAEHGNEIWNGRQRPSKRCIIKATQMGLSLFQYHALRTKAIGVIGREILGDRFINVLGANAVRLLSTIQPIEYLKTLPGDVGIDEVAIAPYLKLKEIEVNPTKYKEISMDDLFAEVWALIDTPAEVGNQYLDDYRTLVEGYGMQLTCYESGQHLRAGQKDTGDEQLNQKFYDFNRDPRIKPLYIAYYKHLRAALGETAAVCHFLDCSGENRSGMWGAFEYQGQPREEAPKGDALLMLMSDRRIGLADRRAV